MVTGNLYIYDSKGMTRIMFKASNEFWVKIKILSYCKKYLHYARLNGIKVLYTKKEIK